MPIRLQADQMGPMASPEIYDELRQIVCDVFMSDDLELSPETSAKDVPGWDSFKMVEIIVTVEERFGVKITSHDVDRLRNLGDLVTMISDKQGLAQQ
jgi:acyl carrier protein